MKKNILITILSVALIGAIGYITYDKFLNNSCVSKDKVSVNDKAEKNTTNFENLNVNSAFVNDLVSRYDRFYKFGDAAVAGELYSKENLKASEIKSASSMAATNNFLGLKSTSISMDDLNQAMIKLFGPESKASTANFSIEGVGCGYYSFDSTTNSFNYVDVDGCGGASTWIMKRKIVSAVKEKNSIRIIVAVAILDAGDATVKTPMGEVINGLSVDTFDIEKDYSKAAKYQYSFSYDADNYNYYLTSIDRVS